jgi:hypothetical protein
MGEPLRLAPHTVVPKALQVGDNVRVSGLRNNKEGVVASHIAKDESLPTNVVAGEVSRDAKGNIRIGRTVVEMSEGNIPEAGSMVVASGEWSGHALRAETITTDDTVQPRTSGFVSLEGYVEHVSRNGRIEMCNQEVVVGSEYEGKIHRGERVILSGIADSKGEIEVTHVFERTTLGTHFSVKSDVERTENDTSVKDSAHNQSRENETGSGESEHNSGSGSRDGEETSAHLDNSGSGNSNDRPEQISSPDNSGSGNSGDRPELVTRPDNSGSGSGDIRPELPERIDNSGSGSGDSRPELPERNDNSGSGSGDRPDVLDSHGGSSGGGGPGPSR